jgi:hypothetical protein
MSLLAGVNPSQGLLRLLKFAAHGRHFLQGPVGNEPDETP